MPNEALAALAGAAVGNKVSKGVNLFIRESGLPVEEVMGMADALKRASSGDLSLEDLQKFFKMGTETEDNDQPAPTSANEGGAVLNSRGPLGGLGAMPGRMAPETGGLTPEQEAQRAALEASLTQQVSGGGAQPAGFGPQSMGRVAGPGVPGGQLKVDMNDPRVQAAVQAYIKANGMPPGAPGQPAVPMQPQAPAQAAARGGTFLEKLVAALNIVGQDLATAYYDGVLEGVDNPETVALQMSLTAEGWTVQAVVADVDQYGQPTWSTIATVAMPEHGLLGRQVHNVLRKVTKRIDDVGLEGG